MTAPLHLDLSGTRETPWTPDELPVRVCGCHGAVLRGEGSVDDSCAMHGLAAQALAAPAPDGELHPLCRHEDHRWVRCDNGAFLVTLYCAELAGHPSGEHDGEHGTRDGARW